MEAPLKILAAVQQSGISQICDLPDRSGALVTLTAGLPQQFEMPLANIEGFIAVLGAVRAVLDPPVVATWPGGVAVHPMKDMSYLLEADAMEGNALLHIRDEAFGWRHYAMHRDAARRLGESLIALANQPMSEAGHA